LPALAYAAAAAHGAVLVVFSAVVIGRPASSRLFPYTTLFRSGALSIDAFVALGQRAALAASLNSLLVAPSFECWREGTSLDVGRSEEHTSELQLREKLVCRLLLEKKNTLRRPHQARLFERLDQ